MRIGGHVFYYRKFTNLRLGEINLEKLSYDRIDDFGIVPVTYIEGYLDNAHSMFMNKFPKDKYSAENVVHISFVGTLEEAATRHNIPWLAYADKICLNVFKAEEITSKTNLAKASYVKNYFMEDYPVLRDFIFFIENIEMPPIDFVVERLGKEYSFLYDILYDCIEMYIWHGLVMQFDRLHELVEGIVNDEIIKQIYDQANLFWKKGIKHSSYVKEFFEAVPEVVEKRPRRNRRRTE
jgi:hypothetical protein